MGPKLEKKISFSLIFGLQNFTRPQDGCEKTAQSNNFQFSYSKLIGSLKKNPLGVMLRQFWPAWVRFRAGVKLDFILGRYRKSSLYDEFDTPKKIG